MAEEYLLVKKTTYDRMKEKQNEKEKCQSCDQGVNTEKTLSSISNEEKTGPPQHGAGLIYAGSRKRKATSPPGIRVPKKRRTTWLTF